MARMYHMFFEKETLVSHRKNHRIPRRSGPIGRQRRNTMKWVTRERPKIDRIACPWLVTRFIDREPEFLFVPPGRVTAVAAENGAIPYDVPGGELKIDRIACPWLVTRFIDREPEFLFVPPGRVTAVAAENGAIPYDVPGVELSHVGQLCSFDSFLKSYDLKDAALAQL